MSPSIAPARTYQHPVRTGYASLSAGAITLATTTTLSLRYAPSRTKLGELLAALSAQGIAIRDISTHETDLEDIFLQLTRASSEAP